MNLREPHRIKGRNYMTERELNQIINKYEELGNRIREYTRINYIKPELIDKIIF